MKKTFSVAILGATGAVGRQVIQILSERGFPLHDLKLFASAKSVGKKISFHSKVFSKEVSIQELNANASFAEVDFAFLTAGAQVSMQWAEKLGAMGIWVIDNSSYFRMKPEIPLVVPEVNAKALSMAKQHRIVANPNCTTAQMVVVLNPIYQRWGMKRVVISSYQAVSGKGQKGIDELERQIQNYVLKQEIKAEAFAHPIAFDCIPQIDVAGEDGFTGEERKVILETKKILGDEKIGVLATCVRVPVFNAHSESVAIETEKDFEISELKKILEQSPGICVLDDLSRSLYPLSKNASGKDEVFVGRIRKDPSLAEGQYGLSLWIVADNLRKGAALNAVQIAEALFEF